MKKEKPKEKINQKTTKDIIRIKMKLYIWRNIRCDYTPGIGFAVATSKAEAIEVIHKIAEDWEWSAYAGELLTHEPEVHNLPYGGWISGGS